MSVTVSVAAPAGQDRVPASRSLSWLMIVGGALGLLASTVLTVEKIRLLENPRYVPSCNFNPVLSCGSVMRTGQASAFGLPNSLIGIGAFSVVVALGVVLLTGAAFGRWFWLGLQAGTLFGIGFVVWLIDQTLYHIGAVCPYCMLVWSVTIPLFWYTTLHNARTGAFAVPASWQRGIRAVSRNHWVVPVVCYGIIALLILNRFWYYWRTQL
jgi:uncharacterized membrane protein